MSRVADRLKCIVTHTHTHWGELYSAARAMANNFAVSHGEQRESCSGSFKCDVICIGVTRIMSSRNRCFTLILTAL